MEWVRGRWFGGHNFDMDVKDFVKALNNHLDGKSNGGCRKLLHCSRCGDDHLHLVCTKPDNELDVEVLEDYKYYRDHIPPFTCFNKNSTLTYNMKMHRLRRVHLARIADKLFATWSLPDLQGKDTTKLKT